MPSPALTVVASAFFSRDTEAQLRVVEVTPVAGEGGLETPLPSLAVVKLAWLETVPLGHGAVAEVVPLMTWTLKVLFGPGEAARSVVQVRTWWPATTGRGVVQAALAGLIDQLSPALLGRVSVMVTVWAMPGPALVAVIV